MPFVQKLKRLLQPNHLAQPEDLLDQEVAVAVVLLAAAHADNQYDPAEQMAVTHLLASRFELTQTETNDLLRLAEESGGRVGDLWPFTTVIASQFTREAKMELMIMVWQVILADGRLDPHEDELAKRLQDMLAISPNDLMLAKMMARKNTP